MLSSQAHPVENTFSDPKVEILNASLKHVTTHGYEKRNLLHVMHCHSQLCCSWTQEALAHGSADLG